jgi:hypothetical protein
MRGTWRGFETGRRSGQVKDALEAQELEHADDGGADAAQGDRFAVGGQTFLDAKQGADAGAVDQLNGGKVEHDAGDAELPGDVEGLFKIGHGGGVESRDGDAHAQFLAFGVMFEVVTGHEGSQVG